MEPINTKSAKEVLKELKTLHCVSSLGPDSLQLLAGFGVKRTFKANQFAWKTGDPGDFIAIVASGLLEITRYTARDEATSMGIFGPSDVIGLSAVMNKKPYPGDAKILSTGTTLLKFYLRPLLQVKTDSPAELQVWLRERFLQHEQVLRDKIDILNAGQIDDRVYEFLIHLARRFGQFESPHSCRIPVRLTRSQVGNMVNGRVETIIRLISRWQKLGLLKWTQHDVVIPNMTVLAKHLRSRR